MYVVYVRTILNSVKNQVSATDKFRLIIRKGPKALSMVECVSEIE